MKKRVLLPFKKLTLAFIALSVTAFSFSQTVYDVIAGSPAHTSLKAAIDQAGLDGVLQDQNSEFTVFAPTNDAFDDAVAALGITLNDLLDSPDLSDILTYHVLGAEVLSTDLSNGMLATPLNDANTIKVTLTSSGDVFVNQAQVELPDLSADNGVVHSINGVILASETVADIALGSEDHTTLVAAVVAAELLPALTNPFAALTVFAPTDDAFADALAALGISAEDLLASEDLASILLYHVLGTEVTSGDLTNGQLADALNTANTIKVTVTSSNDVFVNQAQVIAPDLSSDNGVVHVLDAVILPAETVADIALGSEDHTTLVAAVVAAELLPALTNPFASLTVFAPTDDAFGATLEALEMEAEDLLASEDLTSILLYHVVQGEVLSTDLENGSVGTLSGGNVLVNIDGPTVTINDATVIAADILADNGVVHVINGVLIDESLSTSDFTLETIAVYPNPVENSLRVNLEDGVNYEVYSLAGELVSNGALIQQTVNVNELKSGMYFIKFTASNQVYESKFIKM